METQLKEYLATGNWMGALALIDELLVSVGGEAPITAPQQHHHQQQHHSSKSSSAGGYMALVFARVECLCKLGQYERVVAEAQRVLQRYDNPQDEKRCDKVWRLYVHAMMCLKRYPETEVLLRRWIYVKDGDNPEAVKMLANLQQLIKSNGIKGAREQPDIIKRVEQTDVTANSMNSGGAACTYCCLAFADKLALRTHCQTESHQRAIMSDEGRDWYYRAPPRGLGAENYVPCEAWQEKGSCRFGVQCVEAHGPDELNEWRERFEYRRLKLQRAIEKKLYGKAYNEIIMEKCFEAASPEKVLKESVPHVRLTCDEKLSISISTKNSTYSWTFHVKSGDKSKFLALKGVALLQDTFRNHFRLSSIRINNTETLATAPMKNSQEWMSNISDPPTSLNEYSITVQFHTDIFGTFRQSVVFDFGEEPYLVQHLCADVIPVTDIDRINDLRQDFIIVCEERWNSGNSAIVPFASTTSGVEVREDSWALSLFDRYPCPQAQTLALSQSTVNEKKLTRNNYKSRMHELLFIEEIARYEEVGKFKLNSNLVLINSYLLSPNGMASTTANYAINGELFAALKLTSTLSEDTSAGRLILNNCNMVLLRADPKHGSLSSRSGRNKNSAGTESNGDVGHRTGDSGNETATDDISAAKTKYGKVYEALIEDKGKNDIYLRIPVRAVKELRLMVDTEFHCQIQFQLNRVPYCEWHHSIDNITDFKLIFPETYLDPAIPWSPQRQWSDITDPRLNLKQKEAVVAITTPLHIRLPPVLIIGPFGTGKTFTLAQAVKQLMRNLESRVLICTHSNSAADLYIKDYLHPYVEDGHEEARPLRIYYHKRWVSTVNDVVQKYCLVNTSGGQHNFNVPKIEDVLKHRIVVVTLSISMYLATLDLPRGFFTHIILDEAAQAMECEAIMPLALADENTRIVLAGDHMQLSPELFSSFTKERKLHVSLLERLYDHYPATFPCKILLSENYRAHEAIIDFTSESFYDQKLIASGKQPRHDQYYPLTFFTTRGEDVQDTNSTAFYNNSEVYEIVDRVLELKTKWPEAWGPFAEGSIGIMTPYSDQVFRIRSELRKRRLFGISVERVLNVQGKQFRTIFLSTVRTRRTCTTKSSTTITAATPTGTANSNALVATTNHLNGNSAPAATGEEPDFGFLSNSKLLNTAITRAQSLVAVVGDPVALCSIGRCSKIWERFLQICHENGSLHGITWDSLRNQLDGVELKKTYVLNPLAPEFIPRQYQQQVQVAAATTMHTAAPTVIIPQTILKHAGYYQTFRLEKKSFGALIDSQQTQPVASAVVAAAAAATASGPSVALPSRSVAVVPSTATVAAPAQPQPPSGLQMITPMRTTPPGGFYFATQPPPPNRYYYTTHQYPILTGQQGNLPPQQQQQAQMSQPPTSQVAQSTQQALVQQTVVQTQSTLPSQQQQQTAGVHLQGLTTHHTHLNMNGISTSHVTAAPSLPNGYSMMPLAAAGGHLTSSMPVSVQQQTSLPPPTNHHHSQQQPQHHQHHEVIVAAVGATAANTPADLFNLRNGPTTDYHHLDALERNTKQLLVSNGMSMVESATAVISTQQHQQQPPQLRLLTGAGFDPAAMFATANGLTLSQNGTTAAAAFGKYVTVPPPTVVPAQSSFVQQQQLTEALSKQSQLQQVPAQPSTPQAPPGVSTAQQMLGDPNLLQASLLYHSDLTTRIPPEYSNGIGSNNGVTITNSAALSLNNNSTHTAVMSPKLSIDLDLLHQQQQQQQQQQRFFAPPIQFLQNVHFPDIHKAPPPQSVTSQQQQQSMTMPQLASMQQQQRPLVDQQVAPGTIVTCADLLPHGYTIEDAVQLPLALKRQWYMTLLTSRGHEAAHAFELLLDQTARKQQMQGLIPPQQQQQQYLQQQQPTNAVVPPERAAEQVVNSWLLMNRMPPPVTTSNSSSVPNNNNGYGVVPFLTQPHQQQLHQQQQQQHMHQQQQQHQQQQLMSSDDLIRQLTSQYGLATKPAPESCPLYKRQSAALASHNVVDCTGISIGAPQQLVDHIVTTVALSNAGMPLGVIHGGSSANSATVTVDAHRSSSNSCAPINTTTNNGGGMGSACVTTASMNCVPALSDASSTSVTPTSSSASSTTATQAQLLQRWKQEINEDFARLNLQNGDDLVERYSMTYAGVVRSSSSGGSSGGTSGGGMMGDTHNQHHHRGGTTTADTTMLTGGGGRILENGGDPQRSSSVDALKNSRLYQYF